MQRLLSRALPLIFSWTLVVSAQDAGLALRTSVGYNTQKASLPLSDQQRKQADDLGRQAQQATQAGNYGDAMRDYFEGIAIMHNVAWTPAYELAASLHGSLDHAMIEPGRAVTVMLTPYFKTDHATGAVTASVFLVPAKGTAEESQSLASGLKLDPAALPFTAHVKLPGALTGDFNLEVRLAADGEAASADTRSALVKSLPVHVESLSDAAARLRSRLAKSKQEFAPIATAAYALALYEQADKSEVNPTHFNFQQEFANANAIIDAVDQGRDPFAGKRGDSRRAYRSAVDNTLQPYRILIPASYDGSKPTPLLVALHGMGGDENSMFDGYHEALKREAERVGFLVVCPKGRDNASMYRGSAEQDVMDVIAQVERDYRVDRKRVYLMGHSMGGYGTWSVAIDHPDVFAALGPISGGGDTNALAKIRNIPAYVVHGDNDKTVNVIQSRRMVEAGKQLGMNITYVEVPGGSHISVAEPSFASMLDFFVNQARQGGDSAVKTQ